MSSTIQKHANPIRPLGRLIAFFRCWVSRTGSALSHEGESFAGKLPPTRDTDAEIKVIVMTFSRQHHQAFEKIAETHNWQLLFAIRWADILDLARDYETGVVLIDRNVLGSDWREAVWLLLQPAPHCCAILMCPTDSDHFCEQFLEDGGHSVLKTPLEETDVVQTVGSAWASWKQRSAQVYGYRPAIENDARGSR